ncbi:MAG: ATP-binding protein [Chloroflexota bacterium]
MEPPRTLERVQLLKASLGQLPEPSARPVLIVVSGLPGTGKSYFSRRLAEKIPLLILESDRLRKTLFAKPSYSAAESGALFQAVNVLIEELLRDGISLILDATNLSESYRERLYRISEKAEAKFILVQTRAPAEVISTRLKAREKAPDSMSDADWAVYQKLLPTAEPIKMRHFVVDTSRDIEPALRRIVKEAMR